MSDLKVVLGENSWTISRNGKDYILTPLDMNQIGDIEEEFKCDISTIGEHLKSSKNMKFVIYQSLKEKQPEITLQEVGKLFVGLEDYKQVDGILCKILKVPKAAEAKNVQGTAAVVESTPA